VLAEQGVLGDPARRRGELGDEIAQPELDWSTGSRITGRNASAVDGRTARRSTQRGW
jgi:hypothetical protein